MFDLTTFTYIFIGMLSMMLMYVLLNWLSIRKKEYIYYAAYIFLCLLFISIQNLIDFDKIPLQTWSSYAISWSSLSLTSLMFIAYNFFMIYFLDLYKEENKSILIKINQLNFIIGVFIFLDFMLFLSEQNRLAERVAIRFWISTITLTLEARVIVLLWNIKNKLKVFFLTGTIILLLSNLASCFVGLLRDIHVIVEPPFDGPNGRALYSPSFYLQIGMIAELLCFSLGLGYKRRLVEIEKSNIQLQFRTEKDRFERQFVDLKMTALRAQINPHFMHNSLNAINLLILQGDNKQAAAYLTKFSRLIRTILNNSSGTVVSLEQEIQAITLYLEMESLRFKNHIEYEIYVAPQVSVEKIKLPPMLIQPYIENAIWHGLLPKEGYGHLLIEISTIDNLLIIVIEDNGIGIKKAMENKQKKADGQQSMGMALTEERIRLFNNYQAQDLKVEVEELVTPDGSAAGTKVTLSFTLPK